jgi:hypothetical protein
MGIHSLPLISPERYPKCSFNNSTVRTCAGPVKETGAILEGIKPELLAK